MAARPGRLLRWEMRDRNRVFSPPPKVVGFRVLKSGEVLYEGPINEKAVEAILLHGGDTLETITEEDE